MTYDRTRIFDLDAFRGWRPFHQDEGATQPFSKRQTFRPWPTKTAAHHEKEAIATFNKMTSIN
jgi:hypothetical protein